MPDTTAKIRAKGLDTTGVTEELANQMFAHPGKHYMLIVEAKVEEVHRKVDGTQRVDLVLTQVEPATDERLDEHLRELTRTLYYNRGLNDAQPQLGDDNGPDPKISDVIRDGQALVERDENGEPIGLWDGDDDEPPTRDIDDAPLPDDLTKQPLMT